MSWEKYNVVAYAFALTTPDPANVTLPSTDDDAILKKVVRYGHEVVRFPEHDSRRSIPAN